MSPFIAVEVVAVLLFFPLIMTNSELLMNLTSDAYNYYDDLTKDEVY